MIITLEKDVDLYQLMVTKKRDLPIGVFPIDSIYTPVSKVNYTVEKTRVGQSTDFDKLILDVTTMVQLQLTTL